MTDVPPGANASPTAQANIAAVPTATTPPAERAAVPKGQPERGQELARFHATLKDLETGRRKRHVRVLWMGDSHAAADFWSGAIRDALQGRFGNGGVGFVHLGYRDYRHDHLKLDIQGKWRMRPKRPAGSEPSGDGAFGLGGLTMGGYADGPRVSMSLKGKALTEQRTTFDFCFKWKKAHDKLRFEVEGAPPVTVSAGEVDAPLEGLRHIVLTTDSPRTMTVRYKDGSPDLCGVVVETDPSTRPGVVVDTLGINGARYSTALAWGEDAWAKELARREPDLAILEYGTNEAGDFQPKYEGTAKNLEALVARMRKVRPEMDCLVVSPTDRADAEDNIPPMHAAIKASADRIGCHFYDAHTEMGGKGAMAKMREESQPRAQEDGIHMTIRGYREFGGKLMKDMMRGYDAGRGAQGSEAGGAEAKPMSRATAFR